MSVQRMEWPADFPPEQRHGSQQPILHWRVPPELRSKTTDDTPDEYLVTDYPEASGGCVVWGKYTKYRTSPEWICNINGRRLVVHLIETLAAIEIETSRFSQRDMKVRDMARAARGGV